MMPAGGRPRRHLRRKLKIGFVVGKEDGDLVRAPSIPEEFWAHASLLDEEKDGLLEELVHTDVAIWWHVRSHYSSVEAELLKGPEDVTSENLARNDVNLLLGWDAVSAYMDEPKNGPKMAALLRKPQSRIWPPASLRDLCDHKGDYLTLLRDRGVPVAPTFVYETTSDEPSSPPLKRRRLDGFAIVSSEDLVSSASRRFADETLREARRRDWKKIVVKPSPSSWSRGVETFETNDPQITPLLEAYYDSVKGSKQIIVQKHLTGLEDNPETRCFFFGKTFLYAVANASFPSSNSSSSSEPSSSSSSRSSSSSSPRKKSSTPPPPLAAAVKITDHPEAATDAPFDSGRHLPTCYFERHVKLASRVIEALPVCKAFDGVTKLEDFPCLLRVDVGLHSKKDLLNVSNEDDATLEVFVNELEPVPTLYLDPKFGHDRDFIAEYADRLVAAAADVLGVVPPGLPPPGRAPPPSV